ncbi:Uncharacterized protein TCAP_03057 [Tolypocladium capitatum]|uniref:Uncharacterized protein n=1 Tax=Tolypocladium capitatum TaxID=45235 RepID=A0A2K3QHI8_9HYPO|nr:Uncharacterized protein TCAP_03057 [Tolypocladium capitatum]
MSGDQQEEEVLGALVTLTSPSPDSNVWHAKQDNVNRTLPPGNPRKRHNIEWGLGPLKITGYVDTTTWEVGVSVSVIGINVGAIYGNLKDGVVLKVDLFAVTGELRLYLKHGNEIWVRYDLQIIFDGQIKNDVKIASV